MSQLTSGRVLREARERKGYDLNTVARRLRIRPDILRAIESGDFASMPPRGYTRNMVNAYARLLGLNATDIVNMYLDEAYAEQVEQARDRAPSSGFNMSRETRRSRSQVGVGESASETRSLRLDDAVPAGGTRQLTRILYDDSTRFARDDYGVTRERTSRAGKSDRDFSSHHSGYESTNFDFLDSGSNGRSSRNIYAGQTPMQYSASRLPAFLQSRAVLIGIAVVVLVIVAVVIATVLGGHKVPEEDVSQLPVSGISDTTGDESSSASAKAVEVAPTSSRVIYSVKSGDTCYIEIYTDGELSVEDLTGPAEKTVDVTGVWTITTWEPENVSVTVDGDKVQLKANSSYGGMYAYTVDFPAYLEQWRKAHGQTSSQASASTSNASGSSTTGQVTSTGTVTTQSTSVYDSLQPAESQSAGQEQEDQETDEQETDEQEYDEDQAADSYYDEEQPYDEGYADEGYEEGGEEPSYE